MMSKMRFGTIAMALLSLQCQLRVVTSTSPYTRIVDLNTDDLAVVGTRHQRSQPQNENCAIGRRCPSKTGACCQNDPDYCCARDYFCAVSVDGSPICSPSNTTDSFLFNVSAYKTCSSDSVQEQVFDIKTENGTHEYFPYYALTPLENLNSSIQHVVFIVHGALRNADDYMCAMQASSELAGRAGVTAVIAPHFLDSRDNYSYAETMMNWTDGNDTNGVWRKGYQDTLNITSSYGVMDKMIATLSPNVRVTVAGHSSGGQYVQRYTLTGNNTSADHDSNFQFIVMNPSSYCYFDGKRFIDNAFKVPAESANCNNTYNNWGFGLGGGYIPPYVSENMGLLPNSSYSNLTLNRFELYTRRNITYLIGANDTCTNETMHMGCPASGLETTCADELEGSYRLQRAYHFFEYVNSRAPNFGNMVEVPWSGHDHTLMIQSQTGRDVFFGKSPPPTPPTPPTPPHPSPPPPPSPPTKQPSRSKLVVKGLDEDEGVFTAIGALSLLFVLALIFTAYKRKASTSPEKPKQGPEYSGF